MTDQRPTHIERACRHLWQPYADAERIWQVCVKCDAEEHVATHDEILAENLRYLFREPMDDD